MARFTFDASVLSRRICCPPVARRKANELTNPNPSRKKILAAKFKLRSLSFAEINRRARTFRAVEVESSKANAQGDLNHVSDLIAAIGACSHLCQLGPK